MKASCLYSRYSRFPQTFGSRPSTALSPVRNHLPFRESCTGQRQLTIMGGFFSAPKTETTNFHQLSALDIDKKPVDFASLEGKVVLVSNVASK